ncbi:MAG: hypothetical protein WCI11_02240 [Candidatus Methylumidiphilus sp.]
MAVLRVLRRMANATHVAEYGRVPPIPPYSGYRHSPAPRAGPALPRPAAMNDVLAIRFLKRAFER